ncbi:hypothetical protein [Aquipseudomonas alcaligenes]|nr:hypothetical protein [Pseudomonas alcaligenes]
MSAMIERVSGQRPYVAHWLAYGGHRMFVGVYQSTHGDQVLLATDNGTEAAGFESPEKCAAVMLAHGFKSESSVWLEISSYQGQLSLF